MKPPILSNARQIERLDTIDAEAFREDYVKPQKPVIFGSGITEWGALCTWAPRYLRDQFPHLGVVDEHSGETIRLESFVDQIEKGESRWGRVYRIDQYVKLLCDVSPLPPYLADSWIHGRYLPSAYGLRRRIQRSSRPDLLIGGPASYFPVYHHEHSFCHCLLFQIYGEKRVVLFEPNAKESLYPNARHPNKSTLSPVTVPDSRSYPLFQNANFITGTLLPGDTFFAPSGWWIGMQNPDVSLTLRRHYVDGSNWNNFSREFCRELRAQQKGYPNALKAALVAVILKFLGVVYATSLSP